MRRLRPASLRPSFRAVTSETNERGRGSKQSGSAAHFTAPPLCQRPVRGSRQNRASTIHCTNTTELNIGGAMGNQRGEGDIAVREQASRELVLLRRLASARASGDVVGRRQITAALHFERAQADDLDNIGVSATTRVLVTLRNECDLEISLHGVVHRSVEWAVADFRRVRTKQASMEALRGPTEMPELPGSETSGSAEQANGLRWMLVALSHRDQGIAIEREVLDLPVAFIAKRRRMTESAIEKVCSRALARLRCAEEDDAANPSVSLKAIRRHRSGGD